MSFNDCTCTKCKKRYGWAGKLIQCPPCPRCGNPPDLEALKADQKIIDDFKKQLREKKNDSASNN